MGSLLLGWLAAAVVAACGNVVVVAQGSASGGGGASVGNGGYAGGYASGYAGGYPGGYAGATSTTPTTTTTTMTTTGTSTCTTTTMTAEGGGACTTAADLTLVDKVSIFQGLVKCGVALTCAASDFGGSPDCDACLYAYSACFWKTCGASCDSTTYLSPSCLACRHQSCDPAFVACSGFAVAPGSTGCAALLGNGPASTGWKRGLAALTFGDANTFQAYQALDACACMEGPVTGCADVCAQSLGGCSGDTYCNGQPAGAACAACLNAQCASAIMDCQAG